jgi:hypothetical protein
MKYLIALLLRSVSAFGQSGTPNFSSVRATTGTIGILNIGSGTGGAILTGTAGVLYVGGVAVGSGGGGVSTGTANSLIAGGTIGTSVVLGSTIGGTSSGLTLASGTASNGIRIGTGTGAVTITGTGGTLNAGISSGGNGRSGGSGGSGGSTGGAGSGSGGSAPSSSMFAGCQKICPNPSGIGFMFSSSRISSAFIQPFMRAI